MTTTKLRRAAIYDGEGVSYLFWCPGCQEHHRYDVRTDGRGPSWTFNGDTERPTFAPSLLITTGCKTPRHKPGDDCWCTFDAEQASKGEEPSGFRCMVCHLFLTNGRLQFLSDCTHPLAGRTVDLPDLPTEDSK